MRRAGAILAAATLALCAGFDLPRAYASSRAREESISTTESRHAGSEAPAHKPRKRDSGGAPEGGSDDPGVVTATGGLSTHPPAASHFPPASRRACDVAVIPIPDGSGFELIAQSGGSIRRARVALDGVATGRHPAEMAAAIAPLLCRP